MRTLTLTFLAVGLLAASSRGARGADKGPIVPEGAKLEKIYSRTADIKGGLTEGPAVAPDGRIYFSEIPVGEDKGMIMRFDPKTNEVDVFAKDSHKSNGMFVNAKGELIACEGADHGGRGVVRWNLKTGERSVIADRFNGRRFNAPNDLTIDHKGRIYFSDPKYLGDESRELEHLAVYRIDVDGKVVEVTHEPEKPNGVALSPDDKTLYVIDHNNGADKIDFKAQQEPEPGAMKVYAFPLGPDGLISGEKKTILDFGKESGCDGMSVDAKGNLYLALRSLKRPGVLITTPAGEEIGFIPTGEPNQKVANPHDAKGVPSNCEFGIGKDAGTLYVTVDTELYRIKLNTQGFHIPFEKASKKKK